MKPYYDEGGITIYHGDMREVLPTLDLLDAVVTDPPYGISFMGKGWDRDTPGVEYWKIVKAALMPGAHLLAMGGTRTYHRLACAIEDAGLECRDVIMWLYAVGFPKSLDVGKAIDKAAPRYGMFDNFAKHFQSCRKASGKTQKEIAKHFLSNTGGITGCVWNWENGANVPTRKQWAILQPMLKLSSEWLDLINRVEAERAVIGKKEMGKLAVAPGQNNDRSNVELNITTSATDAAKQWNGWGTALKPAAELICLARKPLSEKTVAANVLKHGTGALNIDGCRVSTGDKLGGGAEKGITTKGKHEGWKRPWMNDEGAVERYAARARDRVDKAESQGRWPANVLLEDCDEVKGMFPNTDGGPKRNAMTPTTHDGPAKFGYSQERHQFSVGDSGSAARFFFCAKTSSAERGKSDHPTMKPVALMRYLCRLVTPPGGVVLDPFMGSGSTLVAAQAEHFHAVGVELEEKYCEIAANRLSQQVFDFEEGDDG